MDKRPTPIGRSGCVCPRCWIVFSSPTGFTRHQRFSPETGTICRDPQDLKLVVVKHTDEGHPVWGSPMTDSYKDRLQEIQP